MANGNGETRKTVAQIAKEVVEQKTSIEVLRNEIKSVANVNEKLDNTIVKLTEISSSIKSMLAVHEEKLSKNEDIDKAIFSLLENRRKESDNKFEDIHSRLNIALSTSSDLDSFSSCTANIDFIEDDISVSLSIVLSNFSFTLATDFTSFLKTSIEVFCCTTSFAS